MRRSVLLKAFAVTLLAFLSVIPLSAIRETVEERSALNDAVLESTKQHGVREQRLMGPVLIVPYTKTTTSERVDTVTGVKSTVTDTESSYLHFLPETLDVRAQVETDARKRGIYSALVFRAHHTLEGSFALPAALGVMESPSVSYAWHDAYVVVGLGDTRGIRGTPTLRWDARAIEWEGGTRELGMGSGIHASVGRIPLGAARVPFSIGLDLDGTESIHYMPVGKQTTVTMKASWPHPSFGGTFLPDSRTITDNGFDAVWKTTHLASNMESIVPRCMRENCAEGDALGVTFIEPVDVYLKSERAAKYGFLFVGITFLVFFLFEVLQRLAIHPIQYALVGIALALFFLLLLALAEHVPFVLAYAIATGSCIGLLGTYVAYVLHSAKRALGFTGMLTALFGALYVLLRSEDFALLLGAALLFGILAVVMHVTRHVDWYALGAGEPTRTGGAPQ